MDVIPRVPQERYTAHAPFPVLSDQQHPKQFFAALMQAWRKHQAGQPAKLKGLLYQTHVNSHDLRARWDWELRHLIMGRRSHLLVV